MLASDVICPSKSPWASPVVMMKKKDGSLRFCADFRQLNAATVKDAHPLPRIDDLLDALHGARWFSTLDLKSGYWQVPIMEWDKEKTAFCTSSGQLYEFNQVPFGLCNAPATFSRLMDRVLSGLHWETCLFYLDDIIVFSSTWEEHLARLCQVFERLRHANLKLGAEKCVFATKEASYLGHRVTEEGLLPDSALLAGIREIPPPKTATEVCSFLGLAGDMFVSEIWSKLLRSLGIQRVLTSPYHPEGNAINERSHRTLNNMLCARLLEGSSSKAWVDKVPGIMLSIDAMPHEPHRFPVSMIATGREPTLPPDVQKDAHASPAIDDPSDNVEAITQRLQLTYQQMASLSSPSVANPYQEGSLIFAMTTHPERTSKLSPLWKGSFRVCQGPNDYQVVYEDGEVQRTIHVNHAIPAKFTAPDLPEPMPPLGYLPAGLLGPRPPPTASAAPARGSSSSSTTASIAPQPAAPAESEMQPSATSPTNQQPEPAPRPRRSPRLNPEHGQVCAIKGPPGNPPHQSDKTSRMARTYPLTVPYNQCLGNRAGRCHSRVCG